LSENGQRRYASRLSATTCRSDVHLNSIAAKRETRPEAVYGSERVKTAVEGLRAF